MENRRTVLKKAALLLGAGLLGDIQPYAKPRLRLGACDWTLGARLSPEAFKTAKAIGLQGVQVSYNTSDDERGLSYLPTLEIIQEASVQTGIQVASLAIGELNRVPYKSEARTEEWVWKSIDAAKTLGVKVILLAFFNKGDLRNDPSGLEAVTERLRKVSPYAERQGITLGIESYLSADEHLTLLRNVNSKAVKVYYDFRNSSDAGHAVYDEIGRLGRKNICEIHMKENGQRLGEGTLDWPRIAKALHSAHYEGWMQIEWACPKESTTVDCHRHNREYLESLFRFS